MHSRANFLLPLSSTAMSILCVERWRCARGLTEWLCTKEHFNPEIAILCGAAARYRRAKVGSSHDDSYPDNLPLRSRRRLSPLRFLEILYFILPCKGHGVASARNAASLLVHFMSVHFCADNGTFMFLVGPSRHRERILALPRQTASSGIKRQLFYLVKKAIHRHRALFIPHAPRLQATSSLYILHMQAGQCGSQMGTKF
jgi:hypothetical protein